MATSVLLQVQRAPLNAPGRDTAALGPSHNSDSGSDVAGLPPRAVAQHELPLLDEPGPLRFTDEGLLQAHLDDDEEMPDEAAEAAQGDALQLGLLEEVPRSEASDIAPDRIIDLAEMTEGSLLD